ncbi:MAG: class I SAM-dependent methyltransferase [archaeon]
MKGNAKIGFTAEAAALIRAQEGVDKYSKYFVTSRVKRTYSFYSALLSKKYFDSVFRRRAALSKDVKSLIILQKPAQVIELGCGYSTLGLDLTVKNKSLKFIETDMENVVKIKKPIIEEIIKKEKLKVNKNYILMNLDVLKDDILSSLADKIDLNKKTLIFSEGVTPYFSDAEYDRYIENIKHFMKKCRNCTLLIHERPLDKKKSMTPGLKGHIIKAATRIILRSKTKSHFNNYDNMKRYFHGKGFSHFKLAKDSNGTLLFVAKI